MHLSALEPTLLQPIDQVRELRDIQRRLDLMKSESEVDLQRRLGDLSRRVATMAHALECQMAAW
jgi:hypothetical protein